MTCENLEQVRENIDRIDGEIIRLIAERKSYVVQASAFKKNEEGVKDTGRVACRQRNANHKKAHAQKKNCTIENLCFRQCSFKRGRAL